MMQLSKSDYMMYLKHPAWLWLKKHDKDKLPPVDENTQAIFDAGHAFEAYAEALFPGGVTLGFNNYTEYQSLPERTKLLLSSETKAIFQGRVESGELTCIFDVIERINGNEFDLYEIKSSTREKSEHLLDLAFQKHLLEKVGLKIRKISVIVVNVDYVRHGEVDPSQMTRTIDVTDRVAKLGDQTEVNITKALEVMHAPVCPNLSPRFAHQFYLKEWLEIFLALKLDTDPYSIYKIASPSSDLLGELEDQGIERLQDIPEGFVFGHEKHKRQVELTKLGKPVIQHERLKKFLDGLAYPLYFLDYETMSSVVPLMDGTRPYQQVPTQYSVHILRAPGAPLEHREFIHRDKTNPGIPLLKQLEQDIGPDGSVIVWYQDFEKGRNAELGEMFPEYANFMTQLNNRVVDLMLPFAKGWYEDYRFFGSKSIKKVLPVLVPELSYDELNVHEGQSAQRLWMEVILDGKHAAKREQHLSDLLEYCALDTLAMVKIYEKLLILASPHSTSPQPVVESTSSSQGSQNNSFKPPIQGTLF